MMMITMHTVPALGS